MSYEHKTHRIYPYIHKGRFYNYEGEKKQGFLLSSLQILLEWYLGIKKHAPVDLNAWIDSVTQPLERSVMPQITWIGHSTFLIQIGGFNILTDPVFGNLSPLFPRILPPGIVMDNLPTIDFVLISHNHPDHMNSKTLYALNKRYCQTTFLVPKGDKAWFDRRGFKHTKEHLWWDQHTYTSMHGETSIEFTFLPAYHWTQRGIFDYNKSLWGSWMIKCNNQVFYFAGDTAYSPHFKSIAQEFNTINVALVPIGPCEPRELMIHSHVNAEEAGQAFLDLKAHHFIPMHWGTYRFGSDSFDLPYQRIIAWWKQHGFKEDKFLHILKVGQRLPLSIADTLTREKYQQLVTSV